MACRAESFERFRSNQSVCVGYDTDDRSHGSCRPPNVWALSYQRHIAAGTETPVTPAYYHSRRSRALRPSRREDEIPTQVGSDASVPGELVRKGIPNLSG
jgi:hypothetical protein